MPPVPEAESWLIFRLGLETAAIKKAPWVRGFEKSFVNKSTI
jgi:hypothetical protein